MSGTAVVAIVVTLFFVIGITVGVITVVALSAFRKERAGSRQPASARFRGNAPTGPAGLGASEEDDIDDQDATVSGVPGHWDGAVKDRTPDNRPWWTDDSDSSSLG